MEFECGRCALHYVPNDPDEVGVCNACFELLEQEGYSLEEMFDRYPAHDFEFEEDEDE